MEQRPSIFTLDPYHYLAKGLVFAGIGANPGSDSFFESSLLKGSGLATSDWVAESELGRYVNYFDATDVSITSSPVTIAANFTASIWVKIDRGVADNYSGIIQMTGATYGFRVIIETATNPSVSCAWRVGGSTFGRTTGSNYYLPDDEWAHVSVVVDGSLADDITFYINGVVQSMSAASTTYTQLNNVQIGKSQWGNFGGYLGDGLIHNRALSVAEIRQLSDPSNVTLSGLIKPHMRKWWPSVTAPPISTSPTAALGGSLLGPLGGPI